MIGKVISHYRILEKLGEGGMGIVYKAHDTTLDRTVALKFLPQHLATSQQDKARFIQEARAASALNHPNICTIHAIEECDEQLFIVMEYVDGQTLRDMLAGGHLSALSFNRRLDIGIQIADGLAAAHEKGIVHRDLKPENIMIRKDGIVQIMDFGLAKLRATGSKSAARITKEGSTVGTAGYMSPEQVQGLQTDHRSDIFSYGILLYELFTGELPFKGVHETALMYEIVNVDPQPMSAVKPEISPELDATVLDCLEKDPKERSQSAAEVGRMLRRIKRESSRQHLSRVAAARPIPSAIQSGAAIPETTKSRLRGRLLPWVLVAVLALAVTALLLYRARLPQRGALTVSSLLPPDKMNFYLYGNFAGPAALSPDGRRLAFTASDSTGKRSLFVRSLGEGGARRLAGTDGAMHPFWSPDNQLLGFFADGKLKKIDASGGAAIPLCDAPQPRGATWNSDDLIIFEANAVDGISLVHAGGGPVRLLTKLDALRKENSHRWPSFLPDGKHFLFLARTSATGGNEGGMIRLGSLDDSTVNKALIASSSNAAFASGYILYARGKTLVAHRFDERSHDLIGEPVAIAENVTYDPSTNRAMFTISEQGTLVYQTGTARVGSQLFFYSADGKRIGAASDPAEYYFSRLSPDGKRVSTYIWDFQTSTSDIWIVDVMRGMRTRLTFTPGFDFQSVWSPDGSQMIYAEVGDTVSDVYQKATSGSGTGTLLLHSEHNKAPWDWSRDGKYLVYEEDDPKTSADLWILPLSGEQKPRPFLQTEFNEIDARFSPDGKWIAYTSDESGTAEVYIKPFSLTAGGTGKWQVSTSGGDAPRWRGDGRELYYFSAENKMMAVEIDTKSGSPEVGHTRPLFELSSIVQSPSDYDVTSDGTKFLVNLLIDSQNQTPLTLVQNWDAVVQNR